MNTGPGSSMQPSEYSQDYFLTTCDGHREYLTSKGVLLSDRLQAVWHYLRVETGMRVLDLGCGRGEIAVQCGLIGAHSVGVDYSSAGLSLAQGALGHAETLQRNMWRRPHLIMGNARFLPFQGDAFDRVVMSDLVEHLYPDELALALKEVYRVLAPGGELLIHTMPNLWYYRLGYPLFRVIQRLQGKHLPTDPRNRFEYSHVHVNEQTPLALRKALMRSPFSRYRVWLYDYRTYNIHTWVMRKTMKLLTSLPLLRWAFCDDIFALARK